jgi:hypothetical protein
MVTRRTVYIWCFRWGLRHRLIKYPERLLAVALRGFRFAHPGATELKSAKRPRVGGRARCEIMVDSLEGLIAGLYIVDRGLRHRLPGFSSLGRLDVLQP